MLLTSTYLLFLPAHIGALKGLEKPRSPIEVELETGRKPRLPCVQGVVLLPQKTWEGLGISGSLWFPSHVGKSLDTARL